MDRNDLDTFRMIAMCVPARLQGKMKDYLDKYYPLGGEMSGGMEEAAERERSALNMQVAGDHYKKLGDYQPWKVLQRWLTPEEFRGYMKGTAIVYLAREQDKGGIIDIEKALHTLDGFIELETK